MASVGVLALQGDVREHVAVLQRIGVEPVEVRRVADLAGVSGLVIPGGESTTMARLLVTGGLREPLTELLNGGLPVLGTCAGLIMLARRILDGRVDQWSLGLLDVEVRRNGFGRQVASFETVVEVAGIGPVAGAFIRAPQIVTVADGVTVLATHDHGAGPTPVLVRQGHALGCAFHPELTGETRIHELFLSLV
ncbi:MAG: pyridoxal 5'-phosphate synthase glutaminase subunit PdxT [Acidimicrobiales bacterium]